MSTSPHQNLPSRRRKTIDDIKKCFRSMFLHLWLEELITPAVFVNELIKYEVTLSHARAKASASHCAMSRHRIIPSSTIQDSKSNATLIWLVQDDFASRNQVPRSLEIDGVFTKINATHHVSDDFQSKRGIQWLLSAVRHVWRNRRNPDSKWRAVEMPASDDSTSWSDHHRKVEPSTDSSHTWTHRKIIEINIH
jgi:hypothetical protein